MPGFAKIEEAVVDIAEGRFVIVVDDEDRENEGDLVMAAERVTPAAVNFMETHARGLICVPLTVERAEALELPPMVQYSTDPRGTAYTVTVDAREGTTTGISAQDQAVTIRALVNPQTAPRDLVRPGHVHPLRARPGGVLARAGHTEAAVDLARLAGLQPAGVICEIKNADGSMARLPALQEFAARFDLRIITVADLISYRRRTEKLISLEARVRLPTPWGQFTAYGYECQLDHKPYVALVMGDISEGDILVRVHSSCLTGDVFHSLRCDCGEQLQRALEVIAAEGRGVLLYIQQEGRDIGLINKLKAYELQEHGKDTVEANEALGFAADLRDYGIGAQVLADLGLSRIRLMTNNPKKIAGLQGYGLQVVEQVPLPVTPTPDNRRYLKTKVEKLGHLIEL
ncbi:MAG: bifunctional 3,4-dihydroxy-2-butanone-4-phosphate synthase/GTP cyclohydrolase II [Armatimonadetes bacterium]|jgi:3,4-dihydroxy 2-butanone 4-phosphate synthase/GTP cyclohydrolase II|nr:bifunctional 3,4-dihydroxy-2-butanone-4-phosphate synthase/GTP cyclohydrolase II [Armatimonadota bacterium]HPO72967.1 bifunctional 3,4-dihydroxy-2-butanone-4-phosphate synthase/GTP cyclohydrolase II [Armatimonadota bacterium]